MKLHLRACLPVAAALLLAVPAVCLSADASTALKGKTEPVRTFIPLRPEDPRAQAPSDVDLAPPPAPG